MSADVLCESGEAEEFKLLVHLGVFGLAVACAAYNGMAFGQRRTRHLFVNALVYLGIAACEKRQMQRHLDTLLQGRG